MKRWMQSQRTRRWWMGVGVLLLTAGLVAWNWQGICIFVNMVPIKEVPPQLGDFDRSKAQSLSAERRAELERELFSELRMWSGESRRYQGLDARLKRQERWIEMAQEGSELAYLTLKVLPPDSFARDPRPTLKRLEEMATQGDAAAMCLYGGIVFQLPYWAADWTPQQTRARYWTEKGAALGHPECLIAIGSWTITGDTVPKDTKQGSEMIYAALRKGYGHGTAAFELRIEKLGFVTARSRRAHYCWSFQRAKYWAIEPDLSLRIYIRNEAPQHERSSIELELNQLRQWHPNIEDCIRLTQQLFGE